jgi:hypothetical protein
MVLLAEQERLYADELQLVSDGSQYTVTGPVDWTTMKSFNIILPKQLIMMVRASFAGNGSYNARITVDGVPIYCLGGINGSGWGSALNTPDIYVLLTSGAHTVSFDGSSWTSSSWAGVQTIFIGQLNFKDTIGGGPWNSGSVALTGGTQTILNQNIAIPASRALPVGTIINYSFFIFVTAKDTYSSPSRKAHFKNVGDSDDSTKLNVKLFINDSQVNFTSKNNDDAEGNTSNPTYGRGGIGYYISTVTPNQTLNLKVKITQNTTPDNAQVTMFVLLCPWITPAQDYQPVDLAFPQGSTFYAWLEPLYNNSTSFASKIGMKRFKSFGDSTDYYSVLSGTGILQHSYMLDVVDFDSATWVVSSTTIVCISYLAVDVR